MAIQGAMQTFDNNNHVCANTAMHMQKPCVHAQIPC